MKKVFTFLMIMAVGFLSINAQVPKGMGSSDPAAKKILDAVSAKFKTFKTVQGKFSLKVENGVGKILGTKTGTVFMKGTKYRISVTGQEIFSDGSNIWTLDKASKEVTISKIDPSANSLTPQKLFTNFYDKDFLYKLNGTTKALNEIELTPIDKTKPFFKILLYVDRNSITSTKLFEKTGNKYTYSTTTLIPNANVPDATFVYDAKKYPGVEVVDLR
ncbi:MAG: outer membrane lipoprotein carrier protein LolA [Ferruginibacter sp.]|nr:outer membrane lipoprotein carrier protein LolA [Ferruginibacter sp.]